jgi:Tfp pilus assembly protein PilF
MRFISVLLLLSLLSCTSLNNQDQKSAALYVELARNQLIKGNAPMALSTLMKAEKMDPKNPQLWNQYGLTYFIFKRYDKSISSFRTALSIDPRYSEARNNYALVLIENGQSAEARKQLQLVIDDLTFGNQSTALSNYGYSYFKEGKYKDAIPFLQKSIKLNKTHCQTYSNYGRALYELKDYSGAMPVFDVAVPLCQKIGFDEAHYYAALTYFKSGDKNRGIALMNETLLLYPDGAYQDKAKSMLELMKLNRL